VYGRLFSAGVTILFTVSNSRPLLYLGDVTGFPNFAVTFLSSTCIHVGTSHRVILNVDLMLAESFVDCCHDDGE